MIRKLPLLAAEYAAGRVSPVQLRTVAAVLPELPEELWGEVDGSLAVLALTMTAAELGEYLRKLADGIEPTPKPREETQQESRRLSLRLRSDPRENLDPPTKSDLETTHPTDCGGMFNSPDGGSPAIEPVAFASRRATP